MPTIPMTFLYSILLNSGRSGLGPTTDISPFSTFQNCRFVNSPFSQKPTRGTLLFFYCPLKPLFSASTFSPQFKKSIRRPQKAVLCCLKKKRSNSRTIKTKAMNNNGNDTKRPTTAWSNKRFNLNPMDYEI